MQIHMQSEKNPWPISGTESEVAGIISATISMKTVRESRTVMPGGQHKTPGSRGLQKKKRKKKKPLREENTWVNLVELYIWYAVLDFSP